jgi:hypothetical protein
MLRVVAKEAEGHDVWLGLLTRDLVADELMPIERANLQAAINRHERRALVFAAAWRVLWSVRSDETLRRRLKQVRAAEQVAGDENIEQEQHD